MDHIAHFEQETTAFHRAALMAALPDSPPPVPSCPEWTTTDLVRHVGRVHRMIDHIIAQRLEGPPTDSSAFEAPADATPDDLADWYADGAVALATTFRATDPETRVWAPGQEQNSGFWLRQQITETALHRWDLEGAIGSPQPVDEEVAAEGVPQFFEMVIPYRRSQKKLPAMKGESYRLRQTDGPGVWSVVLDPKGPHPLADDDQADAELAGSASDLLLFLWHRIPGEPLLTSGDAKMLERFFVLVPPV